MAESEAKRIVWIEDDEALIDVYSTALQAAGNFEVKIIKLGCDGLKWIKEVQAGQSSKPDLVMLDLLLPDMNGIEILEEMRKTPFIKNIPVFVLTNYTKEQLTKYITDNLKSEKFLVKTDWPPSKLMPLIKKTLEQA